MTQKKHTIAGRLTMHRDGYGFVTPDSATERARLVRDIFIPPGAVGSAMHGDSVLIETGLPRSDGRAEGRVIRVVKRSHETVVGIFHYGARGNSVTSIDDKLGLEIEIPRGMERPPAISAVASAKASSPMAGVKASGSPHRVLGAEARVSRDREDLEGVVVDVELTTWPSPTQRARGKVIEIIGFEDDFGVDVEIIIRKYHLPHHFPGEVLEEAQNTSAVITTTEVARRKDYRRVPIVTIDGETARDFDDAVTALPLENKNFQLQVHIADVAHYVQEGSALDVEARLRGTSVYFPDRAVPMLPLELSTDLCSLRPQVERLVLSCVMEVDHAGEIVGYEVHEGVIESAERMTYTDVQLILDGDAAMRARYQHLLPQFELMRAVAEALNRKRVRRGSIDFDLPEPVIEFDKAGLMQGVTRSERQFSHRLIEEFMLAANECVASYLEHLEVPSLYRIHEKPDPKKVYDFETMAATFGYSLGIGALPIQRTHLRSQRRDHQGTGRNPRPIEVPQEVHITPRMYQKLTQKIAGKPEEQIVSYLMLRSLKQARYSEINEGHFALAAPVYTHFTSPIRRYPDLVVHRILKRVLGRIAARNRETVASGQGHAAHSESPSPWSKRVPAQRVEPRPEAKHRDKEKLFLESAPEGRSLSRRSSANAAEEARLHDVAESSSQAERRADDAERELIDWKKMKFMHAHLGEDFEGLIVSITRYGLFVELLDMFVEGLVPIATMTGDHYTYRENTRQIIGERSRTTYSMGDRVRVIVDRIDRLQRKIQFALMGTSQARAMPKEPARPKEKVEGRAARKHRKPRR